jgi:uncharacterized DUF497 family protein
VKAAASLRKHGIAFEQVYSFEWNEALIQPDDRHPYGEQRYYALGKVEDRVFALIFTRRGPAIRVISFRKANDREKRRYAEG